jgi:hypothetical protein
MSSDPDGESELRSALEQQIALNLDLGLMPLD